MMPAADFAAKDVPTTVMSEAEASAVSALAEWAKDAPPLVTSAKNTPSSAKSAKDSSTKDDSARDASSAAVKDVSASTPAKNATASGPAKDVSASAPAKNATASASVKDASAKGVSAGASVKVASASAPAKDAVAKEDPPKGRGAENRRATPHRLFGLADGVFAISMTLLALDVRVPDDVPNTAAGFADGAGDLYRQYGIFLLAFYVTGRFWLSNHRMLARLHHVDDGTLERAVMFLAGICSLPVATTLLFRFGDSPRAVTSAAVLLAVTSELSARLWWYISDPERDLLDIDRAGRRRMLWKLAYNTAVFLLAIPVAYLLPQVSDLPSAWAPLVWLLLPVDGWISTLVLRLRRR